MPNDTATQAVEIDLDAIRSRAGVATQAAANGTTGTPPNVEGLSTYEALDIFSNSANDVPALLAEVQRLRDELGVATTVRDAHLARAERAEGRLARIQELLRNHPECDKYKDGDVVTCGWKRAVQGVEWALLESNA